jgi:hypothetical protein
MPDLLVQPGYSGPLTGRASLLVNSTRPPGRPAGSLPEHLEEGAAAMRRKATKPKPTATSRRWQAGLALLSGIVSGAVRAVVAWVLDHL